MWCARFCCVLSGAELSNTNVAYTRSVWKEADVGQEMHRQLQQKGEKRDRIS
jgi:hypothetical protein